MFSHATIAILGLGVVLSSTVRAGDPESDVGKLAMQLKDVKKQTTLVVKKTVKQSEIAAALGQIFPKVFQYLGMNNIQPASAPLAKYKLAADGFEMEGGVIVPDGTKGAGEIVASELPAGKAAFAVHIGPYEKLPQTIQALSDWLKAKGLKYSGIAWEIYITDPGQTKPEEFKTEVYLLAEPESKKP